VTPVNNFFRVRVSRTKAQILFKVRNGRIFLNVISAPRFAFAESGDESTWQHENKLVIFVMSTVDTDGTDTGLHQCIKFIML
jgi:hypothetical protein